MNGLAANPAAQVHERRETQMRRRDFATGALAAASAAVLPRGAAQAQEKVTLSFLHKWPEPTYMAFFQKIVQEYEAAHPDVTIKMDAVADDPYKAKIRVVMASGNSPDIYFSWSGEYAHQFVRAGRALDITAALQGPEWQGRWPAAMLDPFRFDGKLYGVPMNQSAAVFAYNRAIFARVGVTPPQNWSELLAVCEKLKAAGVTPIALGTQAPWTAAHYIGDLNAKLVPAATRTADYTLAAPEDKLFTDPGYTEALTRFQELLTKGYFNRSPNAMTMAMVRGSFASGREGMVLTEIVTLDPMRSAKIGTDGLGMFPIPPIEGGHGDQKAVTGAPDGFLISSATQHAKQALDFLNLLTSRASGAMYTKQTGRPSATIGAITTDNASAEVLQGVALLQGASAMSLWLDTVIENRIAAVYLSGAQALMGGTATPAQVMENVRKTALEVKREGV